MDEQTTEQRPNCIRPAWLDDLEVHLEGELDGRVHELHLELQEQGLVLHGVAHTYQDQQLAQEFLEVATDVPILANQIEVL